MEGKSLNYDYDIISGNVNQVDYQLGHTDQFSHRYFYDADNRLKEVQTSTDGFVWMDEAQYFYYPHGPLAKVVNGNLEHSVQQQDYHYTLQGWLKGVNQFEFAPNGGSGTQATQQNQIPTDVYDYSLGYYSGDFESVTGAQPKQKISHEVLKVKALYNGNIRWMQTDLSALSKNKEATQTNLVRTFEYDQLQRIKASQSWTVNKDVPTATANLWRTNYSFDPNGNIEHLSRYNGKGELVDDLVYNYEANTNKLIRVGNESMLASSIVNTKTINSFPQSTEDKSVNHLVIEDVAVESGTETVQAYESTTQKSGFEVKKDTRFKAKLVEKAAFLEDQPANNYEYDESGNMIRDRGGNVDTVIWTLDHKVAAIIKEEGRSKVLFDYDELGNRVRKRYLLKQAEGSYNVEKDLQYIYDVRGNMLAVYDQQFLKEQNIFGTSRLGTYKTTQKTKGERQVGDAEDAGKVIFGNRTYEMTNHLGSVMVTVSDRVNKENGAFDAVVISAQDYYPYGLMMEGRVYSKKDYRYGFGGMEKDDEISGNGNSYDFGARSYDPRIGRFKSVDPLAHKMPAWSPYNYTFNNPIRYVDADGRIPIIPWLLKAGAGATADMLAQASMDYLFNPATQDWGQAFDNVNWWQVGRSGAEGLIPWKTPGGKLGRAAATATGDVLLNAINDPSNYTAEQAGLDFATGFVGDLVGGGFRQLLNKYGVKNVANGLMNKLGVNYGDVMGMMGGGLKSINKTVNGITSTRMMKGWADGKVAVIGRGMDNRVIPFADGMGAEYWTGWNPNLSDAENLANNKAWVQGLKEQGYTIYDIGTGPKSNEKGAFYGMETQEIFGDQ